MAQIRHYPFLYHLRAEPSQFVLHYRRGALVRSGAGLAYWFNPLSAALAQVPVEDCETTFVLQERSADFQEVSVQCTVTFRFSDPARAASRLDFGISLATGAWLQQPLQRVASVLAQRALPPARVYLTAVPVVEAARTGAEVIRKEVLDALSKDADLAAMGLAIVSVQVQRVAPSAELEKALQTPTREAIQQKADEAVFERRALAVEKERTIKENELRTEIELARRQEELIRRESENKLLQAQAEAEAQAVVAAAYARDARTRAEGDADARRRMAEAESEAEAKRVALYQGAPARVQLGLALLAFAQKIESIQHLNVSPDLLGESLKQLLRDNAGQ